MLCWKLTLAALQLSDGGIHSKEGLFLSTITTFVGSNPTAISVSTGLVNMGGLAS